MKILIAEDDPNTRAALAEIFSREGFETIEVANGKEAFQAFQDHRPDIVCLDVMMPEWSGYEVCRAIRRENDRVPILFLSAKSEEIDTVVGLELGADDFIVKPFGVQEVLARIRAVTRRCLARQSHSDEVQAASFTMGEVRILGSELRACRKAGEIIELSLREVKILKCLYRHKGQAIGRDQLFDECWGQSYFPNSRTLDQQISQLRKKIEIDPKSPEIIKTVHGVGYRFE